MNELSKFLVENILLEDENPIKKTVVIYVGRFQPFHKGHYATYSHLLKKFGKDNVYIGTSDKVERPKSPFNFKEKKQIMTTMFGIPTSKIYQVKNPYAPTEILSKFDEKTTAFVTVVGEKDSSRLGGKYFQKWNGNPTEGYKDRGYVYASPAQPNAISGTDVRNGLSLGSDDQKQSFFIDRAYGKFNKTIFNLLKDKLNEGVVEIKKERIEEWLLNEASWMSGDGADVDDGPNFFFPNYDVFSKLSAERAAKIGWEVVNMITTKELEDYYDHPEYPNGPTKAVTFFPAGVIGAKTPNNQVDIYSAGAYTQWYKHATRKASLAGYQLVSDPRMKDDKKQSGEDAKGDLKTKKEFEKSITESIVLPVEIGDTLLMGKFKNKKVVVKTIGKDEHGMPTINGKKVVTFRMMKEGFVVELAGTAVQCEKCNHSWDIKVEDEHPYLCHSCGWDSQQQEYDFDEFDSWQEKNGMLDEALTSTQRAQRRWAFQKNRKLINIKKDRTRIRKKAYAILYKRAYKLAYLQVRKEWTERLFGSKKYDELSLPQKQRVAEMVQRKKRKILKLARFRFFPALKQKEAEKFKTNEIKQNSQLSKSVQEDWSQKYKRSIDCNNPKGFSQKAHCQGRKKNEMSMSQLKSIEKYAEKQLSPEDIEFTKHFFDRVNDSRNGKEISDAELTGFFKRLSKHKKQFKDFLEKYKQIVVKDKRYDINIPFVKTANQIIAKTVMRKDDFKTSSPTFAFETNGDCGKPLPNETEDQYRTRCFGYNPLTPPPSGMVRGENKQKFDMVKYYETYYRNLSPSDFKVTSESNKINIELSENIKEQLAKGMSLRDIADKHGISFEELSKEAKKGVKVEMEHTDDVKVAYDIAKDHLFEDPKYYTKLATIEELAPHGYPDQEWMDNHEKKMKKLRKQLDMMSESIESDLSNKYKVDLDIYEYQSHIELRRIVVPQDQRGQGIGSKVMGDLIKYAKSNNKDLFTTPSSDFGGSKSRLIQFYKSFGFKDNKGSNRDFRSKESMVLLVRK
jgi:GNAT superfamily N-acetyltransferase